MQGLIQVLRPLDTHPTQFDFTRYTAPVYECCFVRLKALTPPGSLFVLTFLELQWRFRQFVIRDEISIS
jgi:hypothetical protein